MLDEVGASLECLQRTDEEKCNTGEDKADFGNGKEVIGPDQVIHSDKQGKQDSAEHCEHPESRYASMSKVLVESLLVRLWHPQCCEVSLNFQQCVSPIVRAAIKP